MLPQHRLLFLDLCPSPPSPVNTHQKYTILTLSPRKPSLMSLSPPSRLDVPTIQVSMPCRVFVIEEYTTLSHSCLLTYSLCLDVGFQYVQFFSQDLKKSSTTVCISLKINKHQLINKGERKKQKGLVTSQYVLN